MLYQPEIPWGNPAKIIPDDKCRVAATNYSFLLINLPKPFLRKGICIPTAAILVFSARTGLGFAEGKGKYVVGIRSEGERTRSHCTNSYVLEDHVTHRHRRFVDNSCNDPLGQSAGSFGSN